MHKTAKEDKNVAAVTFTQSAREKSREDLNDIVENDEVAAVQQGEKKSLEGILSSKNWLAWASTSTIFVSAGYAAMYITGLVYHESYLRFSRVPSDLFTKTSTDYFVYAYTAWLQVFIKLLDPFMNGATFWLLLFILAVLCTGLAYFLHLISESPKIDQVKSSIKSSRRLRLIGSVLFIPMTMLSMMAMIPLAIVAACIFPVLVGNAAADEVAKNEAKKMAHGCVQSNNKKICYDLMDGEKLIARGFVIEASEKYIAMRTDNGTEIHPLKERSIKSYLPPASSKNETASKVPGKHK